MIRGRGALCASLVGLSFLSHYGVAQDFGAQTPKGKREPPKTVKVVEAESNLDEEQKAALRIAKKMMAKVYGYKDEIPEEGRDHFQKTIWTVLDGTHRPEKTRSNKFANFIVENLVKELITVDYATQLLVKTAELLGDHNDKIPQEAIDNYITDIKQVLLSSQIATDKQKAAVDDLTALINSAKYNEEKVKQREADKLKKEEAAEKEAQEKADKKAKSGKGSRTGSRTGSRSGGSGGSGGSRGGRSGGS